jgi:hypothetical protein
LSASFLSLLSPVKQPHDPLNTPQAQSDHLGEEICYPQWECNNSFTDILSIAWSVYWPSTSRMINLLKNVEGSTHALIGGSVLTTAPSPMKYMWILSQNSQSPNDDTTCAFPSKSQKRHNFSSQLLCFIYCLKYTASSVSNQLPTTEGCHPRTVN